MRDYRDERRSCRLFCISSLRRHRHRGACVLTDSTDWRMDGGEIGSVRIFSRFAFFLSKEIYSSRSEGDGNAWRESYERIQIECLNI
jgi:hypothetical protein